jgi:histidinol-phosphate/aromatic aminotransferase/cobyric acid decarboxylase-like protein
MSQAFHGGNLVAAAHRFKREPSQFIDFSSNLNIWLEPTLPGGEEILQEFIRYPEVDASTLRQQLAAVYRVESSHVLPTAGAAEALYLAMRLFTGKRVGIIEPAFSDYSRACRAAGVSFESILLSPHEWFSPVTTSEDRFKDFDVIVFGNPNNPTGHFHPRTRLIELMRRFPQKAWVVDEAFIEFVERHEEETLLSALREFPSLLVIGSLTKSWRVPGLRLGFLATSRGEWLGKTALWQPPWSINGVAQLWAKHNLTAGGWAQMNKSLADLPGLRMRFTAELESSPEVRVHRAHANFLLLELLSASAADLYDALGHEGLLVRVCDSFSGVPPDRFIRVAIRNEHENHQLARAMAKFFEAALQPA